MLELVNFANASEEIERLFAGKKDNLIKLLDTHGIDGIELMACEPLQENFFTGNMVKGCHLIFWPTWLSFWRGDKEKLRRDIGTEEDVRYMYGTVDVKEWLCSWRENIRRSLDAGAEYLVFHVAESEPGAICSRHFSVTDEDVITASAELINELSDDIPEDCQLLFENLWWPGLTLLNTKLMYRLLESVRHKNCGFMMDTGHLMNTNMDLKGEHEAVEYVLNVFSGLGDLKKYICGIHLHQSQSGEYVREMQKKHSRGEWPKSPAEVFEYIRNTDRHQPFCTSEVQRILEAVRPKYLVHEFLPESADDWAHKLALQRHALGLS